MAEAIENSKEAIAAWIETTLDEGDKIPTPGKVSDHSKNPEFTGWLWATVEINDDRLIGSDVILAELPEEEQGPFMEFLYGQTRPAPRPGDPVGTIRAYRWDYDKWKETKQFDEKFESGEDLTDNLDFSKARRVNQEFSRTLGKKDRPFGLRAPTKEEMEWVESWEKRYVSRVPKGVFRYNSHEEANADWDKWMALGSFKKED